jgi:murein DD-endopeptidase MepM/ murein hydrolase activator NlpD
MPQCSGNPTEPYPPFDAGGKMLPRIGCAAERLRLKSLVRSGRGNPGRAATEVPMQDAMPNQDEPLARWEAPEPQDPEPRDRSRLVGLGAMGAFVAVGVGLIVLSPRRAAPTQQEPLTVAASATLTGSERVLAPEAKRPEPAPRPPPAWRVASLKGDPSVDVVEGTFGKRGLVGTLTQAGLPRSEIKRLARAFDDVRRFEKPAANDAFVVAKDKATGSVVAFELATSPLDVWQVRFSERDTAKKLDLFVEHKRVGTGLVVGSDLAKTLASAGLRPEIVDAVDDALEGHLEPGMLRASVRLRVAATEDWVDGAFVRVKVDAVEFLPPSSTKASNLRVYYYERETNVGSPRRAPAAGYYDAKGKQPYLGAFRSPLALARVTSRFNPKRLHPVLKVVMPHNGVDYGATSGTPVYASGAGTVTTAGNGGPCGNMVEIDHGSGVTTVYCHLKGFAGGLHPGQKVESRQLVGFVGQTGRVTGPHLHFGVKKNGAFVDPLTLKLDGVRVLPSADREPFARRRAELDAVLDGIAIPAATEVPEESDDKDLHGE